MSFLLLNDTDIDGTHFGCQRVVSTIRNALAARGVVDMGSIKVGTDWRGQTDALAKLDAASVLVINGEGTLHHGKRRGRWLLDAAARVKAHGGSVALINALWQENPQEWADIAGSFDLLWCRDSRSAAELSRQTGRNVPWIGDLSMFESAERLDNRQLSQNSRAGITVSCSVNRQNTELLAKFSDLVDAEFVPITTALKFVDQRYSTIRRLARQLYVNNFHHRFQKRHPRTHFLGDQFQYITHLYEHELLVTGRFHAVCLAVMTKTPFLAVSSNSWKIEALLEDVGLDAKRLKSSRSLATTLVGARSWEFDEEEQLNIARALSLWREEGAALFDAVTALSR